LRDEGGKPIRFDVSEIKAKGLTKAIQDLNIAAKGNVEVIREIIADSTSYNTFLALAANNSEKLGEFTQKMFDVSKTGEVARKALDSVFGIKLNNQAETFDAIVNRITEQFIQFGEQLAPFFDTGVKALETFTKTLSGISPEMKKTIASILLGQLAFNKVTDTIGILVGNGIIMWIYNSIIPELYGFKPIGYWQLFGLYIVCSYLFKAHTASAIDSACTYTYPYIW